MIQKGFIEEIFEGGLRAKVKTFQDEILDDVLLLHPYGETSNPAITTSSLVLLFFSLGSKTASFGIPYNPPLQPTLESGEKAVGNFSVGSKITFKANGDIEVISSNLVDITSTLLTNSGDINTDGVFKVADTQVVSTQGAAVADATGGVVIDVEARAAINALLARLRTHGLIAT